ncbi:MAG: alpha/beta hydrolase, partial [Bacteroidota bacterium]|nr:alpha/beta hydrolase [Bacteroidota bacterium]
MKIFLWFLFLSLSYGSAVKAQDTLHFTKAEIIYGRKDGMALTMLHLAPKENANGKAIISVVSGNWVSSYAFSASFANRAKIYIDKGYTVFVVIHGSQPRYAIPDEINDLKRAVRFIRYNAKEYHIDGAHLGITGASSGGHLSLMVGLSDDKIDSASKDPINKVSSRVQAVAVFYPPTDFLNWGQDKLNLSQLQAALSLAGVAGAFDFKEWNDTIKLYQSVNAERKLEIAKQVSPIYSVSSDDPPILIIHGDADKTVPLQQSESIIKKLKDANVPNQFIIKKDGGHGWRNA